mmetsp:Transcript_16664/g.43179  ORF Transcript_16664/g.43179 Transcript_16664/m.43179 type:complete len:123 (-) Transcript_16664:89-457(-)
MSAVYYAAEERLRRATRAHADGAHADAHAHDDSVVSVRAALGALRAALKAETLRALPALRQDDDLEHIAGGAGDCLGDGSAAEPGAQRAVFAADGPSAGGGGDTHHSDDGRGEAIAARQIQQ